MAVEPSADMMDQAACAEIRKLLSAHGVPTSAFIDDHVKNAIHQRNQERIKVSQLRYPFRNADQMDWDHLDRLLGEGGHGKFWRAVIADLRIALDATKPATK